MEMVNGQTLKISRTGKYLYQVDVTAGTAKLTLTDQSGNLTTDVTNSAQINDFTGILNLAVGGTITAVLTGDAKLAVSFADIG